MTIETPSPLKWLIIPLITCVLLTIGVVNPVSLTSETILNNESINVYGYSTSCMSGWVIVNNTFQDYCPMCGHENCLGVGIKRNDEISCYYCDADYSFDGYEKMNPPRARLIETNEKINITKIG